MSSTKPVHSRPEQRGIACVARRWPSSSSLALRSSWPPAAAATTTPVTAEPASALPAELRIGYQLIPNGDLIVKDQGWLEAALPDTTIKWIKFDSGADVNTAMIAGSIDIGLAGSSPVAAGLSDPHEHPLQGAVDPRRHRRRRIARRQERLRHHRLHRSGRQEGRHAVRLDRPLQPAGCARAQRRRPDARSTIVDLQPPDILAAWQRGDIDAAYVWNPTLAELKKDGTILITSAELAKEGKLTADLAVVTNAFARPVP